MRSDRAAQRSDARSDGADGPVLYPAPAHQEQRETINEKPLFYLVDWLPPDFGAVGQYGLIFAREMASAGRCVKLIGLSRRRSTTVSEALGAGNLEVTRLRAQAVDKSTHGGRLAWTVKTNLRLIWQVVRSPNRAVRSFSSPDRRRSCYSFRSLFEQRAARGLSIASRIFIPRFFSRHGGESQVSLQSSKIDLVFSPTR